MDLLWHDLRFTLRTLRGEPGFTAVAVLTLALSIGASTAIFSMIDAVLIEPLAYEEPERLMAVFGRSVPMAPEHFEALRDASRTVADMAALDTVDFNLVDENGPLRATGAMVTANYFDVFGVRPVLGRTFSPEEGEPGRNGVALISYDLWQSRFAGRPDMVGRELRMYWTAIYGPEREVGHAITVIGVLPRDFRSPRWPRDVWVPLAVGASDAQRRSHYLFPYARLAPGSAREAAEEELRAIYRAAAPDEAEDDPARQLILTPMPEVAVANVRPALLAVTGAVAFVLAIACVNVANLLLARASVREREIAVRMTLGASRGRLVRQLLVESLVLAGLGSVLGFALARAGVDVLEAWQANAVPRLPEIEIGGDVVVFTGVLTVVTALFFGLVPAFRASAPRFATALRNGGAGALGPRSRLRRGLVVAEVALAVVLLVGAGLLLKSFQRLTDVDLGFDGERVLAFGVSLPRLTYREPVERHAFFREAVERLEALPDVESAAAISTLPFSYVNVARGFEVEGRPAPEGEPGWAYYRSTSADYFRTLGIPVVAGETFRPEDVRADPAVMVVSRSMARRYWGEDDPIGSSVKIDRVEAPLRVIGVVGDVRVHAEGQITPTMYLPSLTGSVMGFVLRGRGELEALTDAARRAVRAIDPEQPIYEAQALDRMAAARLSRPRYNALLVGFFAACALLLSAVGIYGVLSFSVSRRTREMGLRRALGARRGDVQRLVVAQGLRLVLVGLGIGLAASIGLTRFLESLLFGVTPTDPATFAAISGVLVAVALAAVFVPARRATRVEPVTALRHE